MWYAQMLLHLVREREICPRCGCSCSITNEISYFADRAQRKKVFCCRFRKRVKTMSESFPITKKNKVRQLKDNAKYDVETVHNILDAGIVAHVAFVQDGEPVVVPMIYGRKGNTIFLHGARKARVIRLLEQTERACLNVTLLDGIVYARSVFNSSMNYRSVTVFGEPSLIEGS